MFIIEFINSHIKDTCLDFYSGFPNKKDQSKWGGGELGMALNLLQQDLW